jgi:hypothetical protein
MSRIGMGLVGPNIYGFIAEGDPPTIQNRRHSPPSKTDTGVRVSSTLR